MLCQCCHVVATRLRGTRGLGWGRALCQSPEIETPQAQQILQLVLSYTLHKPPTDAVSYGPHVGL